MTAQYFFNLKYVQKPENFFFMGRFLLYARVTHSAQPKRQTVQKLPLQEKLYKSIKRQKKQEAAIFISTRWQKAAKMGGKGLKRGKNLKKSQKVANKTVQK